MLTRGELVTGLQQMGARPGDTLLLHSSFKSLGGVEGGPQTVVDALCETVGPAGTVILPVFNFSSWTETHYFDVQETRSEMGAITELARHDPRFVRTLHPIYSFVVAGAKQRQLTELDPELSYGSSTVFEAIQETNALMISFGLHFNNTFSLTHHVEETSGVCDYRYVKRFSGIYVDRNGFPSVKTYSMRVRDVLRGVETDIVPAMNRLIEEGAITTHRIRDTLCHASRARDFATALLPIVKHHPEMLHRRRL